VTPMRAMRARRWIAPVACALLVSLAAPHAPADALTDAIVEATKNVRTFPDVPDALDATSAYAIQSAVVQRAYGAQIAGYKAGLTSAAVQQRFGVDQPVLGVLPESGRIQVGSKLRAVPGLKVEVEIGFLVGVEDTPAAMFAAIELPRLDYPTTTKTTLADIIATNVSAYRFIVAAPMKLEPDVRRVEVSLDRDGQQLFTAFASDAMGDPTDVYEWLVPRIHSHEYPLRPGMVLITGSLGRVIDGEPGAYVAHYGELGDIKFTIEGGGDAVQTPRQ